MSQTLVLVTSCALRSDNTLPPGVITAFERHLANPCISGLVVLTETAETAMRSAWPGFADARVTLTLCEVRPTFDTLLSVLNNLMRPAIYGVIVNADVSFEGEQDCRRLIRVLSILAREQPRTALCLTRYDLNGKKFDLQLRTRVWLPNTTSADAWVFPHNVQITPELFYRLGDMFCDKFLHHDLIVSGYRLFNPCMDCRVLHHDTAKDIEYYRELTRNPRSQQLMQRHQSESTTNVSSSYFDICHVHSEGLEHGYRPVPLGMEPDRRRMYLVIDAKGGTEHNRLIERYAEACCALRIELFLVVPNAVEQLRLETLCGQLGLSAVFVQTLVGEVVEFLQEVIRGEDSRLGKTILLNRVADWRWDYFDTIQTAVVLCKRTDKPAHIESDVIRLTHKNEIVTREIARTLVDPRGCIAIRNTSTGKVKRL